MTGSKPVALPLGDTPILLLLITYIGFICKLFLFYGALGEIRTHDLRLRRATLYPAELQAHCLFARLKHSYECTRLARLLGASRPLVPDGTVLTDVVHLRSPNSRPSLIKGDTLSCLSYKRTVFSRASSILTNARAWRGCSGPHVPSSLTGPSLRTSFTCAHRTHDLRSSRATLYRA